MSDTTRIAAAQIDSTLGDTQKNLAKMVAFTGEAAGNGAQLVVFPECALTGYQYESRDEAMNVAEAIPGLAVDVMSSLCAKLKTHVIFGMLEMLNDSLFNTAVLVGPDGLVFKYHKNHIPFQGVDRYVDKGDRQFELCQSGDLQVGLQICYDIFFPESSRVHSLLGADLITLPTNFATMAVVERAGFIINTRAIENKVYVLSCNRVGEERGYPFCGHSKIVDPMGVTIAEASADKEEIIYADIDPALARTKRITHAQGQWELDRMADRRPELYGIVAERKDL